MDTRLTQHLRRQVLELPYLDRVLLLRDIADSVRGHSRPRPQRRLAELGGKMRDLTGEDVCRRGRTRHLIACRNVFTLVARLEGYSQDEIGRYLGQSRSTVCCCEKRMRGAMTVPEFNPELIQLYNDYTQLTTE